MSGPDYTTSIQQRIALLSGHIDSLWFADHLQLDDQPVLEAWTALTYWAALYPQLSVGHLVLCQSFRHPSLLAKMAATLHYLTHGHFILGLGAGWQEDEYGLYQESDVDVLTAEAIKEEDLRLVCYERLLPL